MVKRLASQCDVVEWLFDWYKRSAIIINFHWHQIRLVKLEARFVSSFSSLFIKKKNDNKKLDRVRIRRTCLWHCFESTEKKAVLWLLVVGILAFRRAIFMSFSRARWIIKFTDREMGHEVNPTRLDKLNYEEFMTLEWAACGLTMKIEWKFMELGIL